MRVANVSDLHVIDERLDGPHGHEAILDAVATEIVVAAPDLVVVNGDLSGYTVPHKGTPRERNVVVPFLRRLAEVAPVAVVAGNHDFPGDWDFLNSIATTCGLVYSADDPEFLDFGTCRLLTLPWVHRSRLSPAEDYTAAVRALYGKAIAEVEAEILACRAAGVPVILAGHVAFEGAEVAEGQPDVPVKDPTIPPALICRSDLFDLGVFGHYHFPQPVAPGPFVMGGSLFVSKFGEDVVKGWRLFDTEAGDEVGEFHPIEVVARVVVEFDPAGGRILDLRPNLFASPDPAAAGMTLHDLVGVIGGSPALGSDGYLAHVRLVPTYAEGDAAAVRGQIEEIRAAFAPVALSVTVDPKVLRVARVREGAREVAAATNLADKVAAAQRCAKPEPDDKTTTRALALFRGFETEVDLAAGRAGR